MDLLKRFGLLLAAAFFAFLGFFFGFLRFLQDKDGGVVAYVVQDVLFILSGLIGVFVCSRVLSKMRKEKIAMIAAQPLPEFISAGMSVKAKLLAALLILLTIASAYGLLNIFPDPKGSMILLVCTGLCGLLTYIVWLQFDRDGETLRIDQSGINHKWYGNIPWSQIVGISMLTTTTRGMTIHTLFLGIMDRQKYLTNMPWLMRKLQGLSGSADSKMSLHIPLHLLNVDANLIEKMAHKHRALHQPPMLAGWHYFMTENEFKSLQEEREKFQMLDDDLKTFENRFITDNELTALEIESANKQLEALLSKRSKLVTEHLESRSHKLKTLVRNSYLIFGVFITSICGMIFFAWRSNRVFGVILLVAIVVVLIDIFIKPRKKVP